MRKPFAILLLLFAICATAQVEVQRFDLNKPHRGRDHFPRFRLDGGMGMAGCQGSFVDTKNLSSEKFQSTPIIHVEAEYRPMERLGLVAHYSRWSKHITRPYRNDEQTCSATTLLLGTRWYWNWNTPRNSWYSGLMGGWAHRENSLQDQYGRPLNVAVAGVDYFAHQITFIGMRTAGPVGLSVELGQGYKGFLSFGLSVAL